MQLPITWNDVNVSQFIELKGLQVDSFDSIFDFQIESIGILADIDTEELNDLDFDELNELIDTLKFTHREPNKPVNRNITDLHYIGFQHLKVGEFIDLEYYFTNDYNKHLDLICAIVYRKQKLNEWNEVEIEPYKYDINVRKELFKDVCVNDVYGVVKDYIKFRDNFMNMYINLFQEPATETDDDLTEDDKEAIAEEDKINKWSWEKTLYVLANEDITKIEYVLEMNLIFAFNMLSMKTDLKL